MTPVSIREFGDWCREAGIDEWKALIKIAAGSHEAAYLLHYALQWSGGEAVAASDGWFYRTADEIEADTGLNRRGLKRAVAVLQREIKLEAANRRIKLPSGDMLLKTSMHYRVNRVTLAAAFGLHTVCIPDLHIDGNPELNTGGGPDLQEDGNSEPYTGGKAALRIVGDPRLQPDGKTESLKESFNEASKQAVTDATKQSLNAGARAGEGETSFVPPLHKYLVDFVPTLGEPNGHRDLLEAEIDRLGDNEAREVLIGCDNAQSWQYLLTSLRNRATPRTPPPSSAPPPSGESWAVVPVTYPPLGAAWVTACMLVNDPAAHLALTFGATITEPDVQVVRVEAGPFDGDLLKADGVQAALDMMRDMDIRVEIVQQPKDDRPAWTTVIDDQPTTSPDEDAEAIAAWAKVCRQLPQLARATKLTKPVSLVEGVLTIRVTYDRAYAALTGSDRHRVDYAVRDVLGDGFEVQFELAGEKAGAA